MTARSAWAARWSTVRLAHLLEPRTETGQPDLDVLSVYRDYGVIRKSSRDDNFNRTPADLSRYQVVHPGDVVVNRMKAWQGSLGVAAFQGLVSPDYDVLRPTTPQWDKRFLHHLLRSRPMIGEYAVRSTGIRPSQWRLYWSQMRMIDVPVPEVTEQRAIAAYLDREMARIDILIEGQQRLVEMLEERRQALIDSALPSEGVLVKLGALFEFHNGDRGASYPSRDEFAEQGIPFVNAGHLRDGKVDFASMNYVTSEKYSDLGGAKLLPDDILFCLRGSLGKFGVYSLDGGSLASSLVAMRRLNDRVQVRYFAYILGSSRFRDEVALAETGSAQPNLSVEQLRRFPVCIPGRDAQRQIVAYLDEQTVKIDTLIAETERFIELARERRAALIAAAVTGQIDVREVA